MATRRGAEGTGRVAGASHGLGGGVARHIVAPGAGAVLARRDSVATPRVAEAPGPMGAPPFGHKVLPGAPPRRGSAVALVSSLQTGPTAFEGGRALAPVPGGRGSGPGRRCPHVSVGGA